MLLGGGEPTVNPLLSVTCLGPVNPGGISMAYYSFYDYPDPAGKELGSIYRTIFGGIETFLQYWLPGSTIAQRGQYELRGTLISSFGSASSVVINGAAGSGVWVALPGTYDTFIISSNDDAIYEVLMEIRRIGTTNIISSATITFETFGAP
jgi:hypothetical protein